PANISKVNRRTFLPKVHSLKFLSHANIFGRDSYALVDSGNHINASNTGVVKLAAFVRLFAQKMTALPRPRALTC
ncbi:hypothetical protein, partial [Motilimonas pumila]|uniref:hypothetical protein n=1 Tax=Motilimonas pumila TaxID=2303987 RepID=UPI001E5A3C60